MKPGFMDITLKQRQLSEWIWKTFLRPRKACQVHTNVKKMMIIFFGYEDVVHNEFVPKGETVNKKFYLEVIHSQELIVGGGGEAPNHGWQSDGCSTMTMLWCTHQC
jgi:hypothetical protein